MDVMRRSRYNLQNYNFFPTHNVLWAENLCPDKLHYFFIRNKNSLRLNTTGSSFSFYAGGTPALPVFVLRYSFLAVADSLNAIKVL